MAARLNSNEGNDSPLIGAAQIGKTVFESRCSQALDEARLRESWGQVSRKRQSTIDHASIDSSSIHDREGIGIESRWKCEPRSAVPSHGRDVSLSFHLARPTSLRLDEMLIIHHDACVIRPEAERALGPSPPCPRIHFIGNNPFPHFPFLDYLVSW